MVKKKQPDFQPKQLRVGKHLPKGRNVTNVSFKAKKIIVNDQKLNTPASAVTLDEILRETNNQNVARKIMAIKRVESYIEENTSTLSSYYSEVLRKLSHHLIDSNPKVRQETMEVFRSCLHPLSTAQMNFNLPAITSYIDCMMTHSSLDIRRDSLEFLGLILKSHPSSICHSLKLLRNLLNMISSIAYNKHTRNNSKQRKLNDNINSKVTSVKFRDEVFKLIHEFLKQLVDTFAKKKKKPSWMVDEQRVFWDGKGQLFLQLYAGSGLQPAKLEIYSPSHIKSEIQITKELGEFFDDLINISSDIVTEETAILKTFSTNSALKPESIDHLNTVTKALCCFCDWYNLGNKFEDEDSLNFKQLMNKIICEKLMKGFIYPSHEATSRENREDNCNELNLGIIYLYTSFIIKTRYVKSKTFEDGIICLTNILEANTKLNTYCMQLTIKIMKNVIEYITLSSAHLKYVVDVSHLLENLCDILKVNHDKDLQFFFMDIAMIYDYKFLFECKGMKIWVEHLFEQLETMKVEKTYDQKLLKCINLLCARGEPAFLNVLNHSDYKKFLDCLKFEDYDFRYTGMNLLTNMIGLPVDFLQYIAKVILSDENFSSKTVVKFIHLLHIRFRESKVTQREYFEFVLFLLNVGCDMYSIEKADREGNMLMEIAKAYISSCQGPNAESSEEAYLELYERYKPYEKVFKILSLCNPLLFRYRILPPSPIGDRHSEIAKECLENLLLVLDKELSAQLVFSFIKGISDSKAFLPLHCATALHTLAETFCDKNRFSKSTTYFVNNFCDDILVSSMFYTSSITHEIANEHFKNLGIFELERALGINEAKAKRIVENILQNICDGLEVDSTNCVHAIRIIKYFYLKMLIDRTYLQDMSPVIEVFANFVNHNPHERALFYSLYEIIQEE